MAISHSAGDTGFKSDLQRLGHGVDTLKSDVGELAHDAAEAARSGAAEVRQGARQALDAAKDKFTEVKGSATDATHSLQDLIGRHPLASVGIAAGVGVVLSLILFRPRS